MKTCHTCNAAIHDSASFCPNCGSSAPSYPAYPRRNAKEAVSVGGWIGRSLIPMIPFVGGIGETVRAANTVRKVADTADDFRDVKKAVDNSSDTLTTVATQLQQHTTTSITDTEEATSRSKYNRISCRRG